MIKIRLSRTGPIKKPFYRIVATDDRKKNKGKSLETIGTWSPKTDKITVDKEKLDKWIKVGAQVTPAVKKLIKS